MTHRLPRSANRCRGQGFRGGALAGQASSSARLALARPRHPKPPAACRVALVVRSGIPARRDQTLEDSLRSGTPFPRSLPTRRWSTMLPFFPSALICCAGRMKKMLVLFIRQYASLPPQPFFPRPPLRSSLRGGRGTSQGVPQACRRERGQARHAPDSYRDSERSERLAGRDGPNDRSHAAGQQTVPEAVDATGVEKT